MANRSRRLTVASQRAQLRSDIILQNLALGDYQSDVERILRICREVGGWNSSNRRHRGPLLT
jgi:ABC-type transport system involved in cytochrome bd biosynthesis fused ATPase/permease subunit